VLQRCIFRDRKRTVIHVQLFMHFHVPLDASRATISDSGNKVVIFPSLYLSKNCEFKNISINVKKNHFNPVNYTILSAFTCNIISNLLILVSYDYIIILYKILA